MKLLVDENLPLWLAGDLRKLGVDAADVRELAKPGLGDDDVYRLALRGRRHIVTVNYKDFGNPLLYPPTKHTGIIVVRMPKCSVRTVASHLMRFLSAARQADLSGSLIVVEPARIRKRKLA